MSTSSFVQKSGKITFILTRLNFLVGVTKFLKIEKIIKWSLLSLIRAYKSWISPYKGFDCAYRKLHYQQSCSSYFYSCIASHDLSTASILLQQRLIDCKQAAAVLKTDANYQQSKRKSKRKQQRSSDNQCLDCGSLLDIGFFFPDCGDCDGDCCDLGGCDLS